MGADNPHEWALDKRARIGRRAQGDTLEYLRRGRDVCCPGVPLAALLGFAANGGTNENTTGWIVGDDTERATALRDGRKPLGGSPTEGYGRVGSDDLHELGPFGVEGGHCPDLVAGPGSTWHDLASGYSVRKILDRDAVTGSRWHGAVADQYAVGIANLARHSASMGAKLMALNAHLGWDSDDKPWSLWRWAITCASWSAGSGGTMRHLQRYMRELATVAEGSRWGAFVRLAAAVDDRGAKHRADEYTALRTCQKIEAARLAVQWVPDEPWATAWLDDGLGADRDAVYAALVRAST